MSRTVLTIATGKKIYWDMAVVLARSFEYWNAENDLKLLIVTDRDEELPRCLRKTTILKLHSSEVHKGFSSKLYLDMYSTAQCTLFIDADCMCVGPLDSVFHRFSGKAVSVVGGRIASGEWFGDVKAVCSKFGIQHLPKFNGGVYYFEKGRASTEVYQRARSLEPMYDELGLVRLRGLPNDELLMAIAMALEGCDPVEDDGNILGEFLSTPELIHLDILRGRCTLRNPDPPDPRHQDWYPLKVVNPVIVHYLGYHESGWAYRREALKLRLVTDYGVPRMLAQFAGVVFISGPARLAIRFKDWVRPLYHKFVGPRPVRPSKR